MQLNPELVALLRCPIDGGALRLSEDGAWLLHASAARRYPITDGIARLLPEDAQALTKP